MPGSASTATQRVHDGVYAAIVEHRLTPGTWLREEELAAAFGVSRTVVRQALHRLAQDRVVVQHPNRGAQVPQPDRAEAGHVFDARRVVECEVARRLAGRLTDAQVERLKALVAAEDAARARGDQPATIRLSGEFHRVLAELSGNPVFVRLVEELLPATSVLMALYQPLGHPGCIAHRHVELIAVLQRAGGGARASAEMRRHLAELEKSLALPGVPTASGPLRDVFQAYREPSATKPSPTAKAARGLAVRA